MKWWSLQAEPQFESEEVRAGYMCAHCTSHIQGALALEADFPPRLHLIS